MTSRTRASASKKLSPLEKRIPENPRYAHVKPTVDTGASISKYLRHLEDIRQNYRYRKDEIFRRLKVTTFAQLVLQVEALRGDGVETEEEEKENSYKNSDPFQQHTTGASEGMQGSYAGMDLPEGNNSSPPNSARSTLSSVISGVGELDVKERSLTTADGMSTPRAEPAPLISPYLLLDVRDPDSFEHSHIITAKNYPAAMLSRSLNYFTKDILEYRRQKNKPGKIIIVYDEDERICPSVATTFIQREVDNIFMLSGGMKVLNKTFPDCMITGPVPASCVPSPPNSSRSTTRRNGHGFASKSHERGVANFSPRSSLSQVVTNHKERFSEDDLDKIQSLLDSALMSGSSSSRASSRSSVTTTASSSHRSTTSSTSRASSSTPWK